MSLFDSKYVVEKVGSWTRYTWADDVTMLPERFDVNESDKTGNTPIYFATSPVVMSALLARGANLRNKNLFGRTVLHNADHVCDCIDILVAAGADVNAVDKNGRTPIFYTSNITVLIDLERNGANLFHLDDKGNSVLHKNVPTVDCVRYFLQRGVKSTRNYEGLFPSQMTQSARKKKMLESAKM